MRSIRSFLLTRLLGGTVIIFAVAGVAVYVLLARALERQFDVTMADRVQQFASILFQVENELELEFSGELMPEYERVERAAYFQLWFTDGRLIERSDTLAGDDLQLQSEPSYEPQHWSAPLPDGRPGRYVAQFVEVHHVYPEAGPDRPTPAQVLIVIARGTEDLAEAEARLMAGVAAVALALTGLIALVSTAVVRRGLEPANRLARALDDIEVDRLPESLDVGALPRELGPMSDTTNALIRRVDDALERERRTTADIAHELRTPISELITVSEVALRNGRDPTGERNALGTIRTVAWRMGRSISTLLKLARLEVGAETFDHTRVELGALVGDVLSTLSRVGRDRELEVTNQVNADASVDGDAEVLRIVVTNLLSNALHHGPPGTAVVCRFERSDQEWHLFVENAAPDLVPDDLRVLTEPYWRKDSARVDRNRSGLGLALSHALAERVGLEMTFALENGTFRVGIGHRPSVAPTS